MNIRSTFICLFCFSFVSGFGQEIIIDANKMVADESFTKLLFDDLNFLILGDNTPSQGFSTELTEKNSELALKGLLLSDEKYLLTVDGNFSVDEGVYFFDENEGSKKSKFTVNFFKPFKASRKFPRADNDSIARSLIVGNLARRNSIYKSIDTYFIAHRLMEENGMPVNDIDDLLGKIDMPQLTNKAAQLRPNYFFVIKKNDKSKNTTRLKDKIDAFITKHNLKTNSLGSNKGERFKIINIEEVGTRMFDTPQNNDPTNIVNNDLDKLKLIQVYENSLATLDSLRAKNIKSDLKRAEKKWSVVTIPYFSVSGFYQRESLTIFENTSDVDFNDLFDDQFGDLYGIEGTLNVYRSIRTSTFYARLVGSLGRGSNFTDFKKKTYIENDTIAGTQEDPVFITNQKVGYSNSKVYSYGLRSTFGIELFYLISNFGAFATFAHNGTYYDFEKKGIKDKHIYPFRAGFMTNLKAKKDAKTALTLQVFVDRSDVTIDPTGSIAKPIDDWRFGFKFGLPIFLKPRK